MTRNSLATIFVIVFVDLLGFSLILPLLPYYAEQYGANPTIVGLLVASYALMQLIGAPVLGRLSDRHGRRPILLLSVCGTFIGFLLLAFAQPIGGALGSVLGMTGAANLLILSVLFISRMLDGITGGNLSVAQAYISDVTDEKNRSKAFGLIGAAFGLGFIIGPAVGGILSQWGYAVPALAAASLSFLNLIAIFFWLPESLTPDKRAAMAGRARPAFSLSALARALNRPRVGPLLHIRFFFALAFSMFQSIFALYAQYKLGLNVQETAYILTYVGVLSVIVQGFAIGWLAKRFDDKLLIVVSLVIMTLSLVGWALAPNLWILLVIMAPLSFAGGTLNTVINSALSKSVYPEEIGGALGLSASLESFTRVVSPSAGGLLLQMVGAWAPGLVSALLVAWATSFAYRRLIVRPDPPLPARGGAGGLHAVSAPAE
ncbi:MAG: MFS transporter [Anaerolineae bacterium]